MIDLKADFDKALLVAILHAPPPSSEDMPGFFHDAMLVVLAHLEKQGWVLVPKEATEEMVTAAGIPSGVTVRIGHQEGIEIARLAHERMISARPTLEGEDEA